MNYPVWNIPAFGSSLLIIIVAILHVYVAHFAIGGGLFLVLTEAKGHREKNEGILKYVKSHSHFFLLLTMVFGAVSGVGIWFTISVIAPSATSTLIHSFVFAWAIEWVFFGAEIVALFVYASTFGKLSPKKHMQMGWLYFIFAWLSLFAVNGIITMMLTPGQWVHDQSFWSGFFNPSMFPSLVFRTFLAFMLAGLFGFLTATRIADSKLRDALLKYCAKWLFIPLVLMALSSVWYLNAIPGGPRALIMGRSPEMPPLVAVFAVSIPVIVLLGIALVLRIPPAMKRVLAFVLLLVGLAYMGAFEWIREGARRPYVLSGHTYSNGILVGQEEAINKNGFLATAKWVKNKTITDENRLDAGRELFMHQCQACHTIGGIRQDIIPVTAKYDLYGMTAKLNGLGKVSRYMPQFFGTAEERDALARYIVGGLHKKPLDEEPHEITLPELQTPIPPFDGEKSPFVLLSWSQLGAFCYMGENALLETGTSKATFEAQLIRRGESPEIVSEGVDIFYRVEENRGAFRGKMELNEEENTFVVRDLPLEPYDKAGAFRPYPTVEVQARKGDTGEVMATSRFVLPVSTELGCKNCHGRGIGAAEKIAEKGVSRRTAEDILAVHDRIEGTELLQRAQAGEKVKCKACHTGRSGGKQQGSGHLNMSASIHGWHANYLTGQGTEACASCHASAEDTHTRFFRGYHAEMGFDCTSCHGTMEDHALSLLKHEEKKGKPGALWLMKYLKPRKVDLVKDIAPRKPWTGQPDCLHCHIKFNTPDTDETFNRWTGKEAELYYRRMDDVGLRCAACHGSPHAVYPATNPYGEDRDNIQPMQYQGEGAAIGANGNCAVCHKIGMEDAVHHPNIE